MVTKTKKTLSTKVVWMWIIGFFVLFAVIPQFIPASGSTDGSHTGIITAVEYNSNILWSANLVYVKTSSESTQEDIYCVNDPAVKNQLVEFSKKKQEVVVYYQNNFFMWKWECNGGQSIIYKVERAAS